jgi:phenylalanyl-tRNA synthetase beta chain
MIYNYLGSRKDLVENMRGDGSKIIKIANPMTENYEYVRDSVLASLMNSEGASGHASYPHCIFEIGKVAYRDDGKTQDNAYFAGGAVTGTATRQYAGFLYADKDANFNTAAGQLQTLFYYIARDYEVEESQDSRYIPGRAASILYKGKVIGSFGEVHPEILENWGVTVPCTAGEFDLDALL